MSKTRMLLIVLVSFLYALPLAAAPAVFVFPDDFIDGTLELLGPQPQHNSPFPYMYRLRRRSCSGRCLIGRVFERVGQTQYIERSPSDIRNPQQRARYERLLEADRIAMNAWDRSDPTVDVTAFVRKKEREIKDVLRFTPQSRAKQLMLEKFPTNAEWDLKRLFAGDRCLTYNGIPLEKGDVANHAFGVAMAATGHSLAATLQFAHEISKRTRGGELDQPQDQAAVMAGWVEERTGRAWADGLYEPRDFIRMRCETPGEYRSFWSDAAHQRRWDQLIRRYDR